MALSIRKAEDWAPHEAEIRSLYIDQNWTLGKTMKHMELKYGFKATVRQYKRRFNKNKNLTTPEWILIGKLIQKRTREGKRTDVLLHQRQVDPKKVTRELARRKLEIGRAKTPVNGDDQVHGRTSFRTPRPSPGPSDVPRPPPEDDGNNLLWETYVALSPADSTCSVSHVLRRESSDQDMEEVISELSIPSAAPSEIDYGDLEQLDIEFWTLNLPIVHFQRYLREQGKMPQFAAPSSAGLTRKESTFSSVQAYPLSTDHNVTRSISHSWSEDSLKVLLSKGLPQLFHVAFPADYPYIKSSNALEIALFAITNNLLSSSQFYVPVKLRIRVLKWLIEPAHLALMDSLRKAQVREFSAFAHSFLRLSSDLLCFMYNDESQRRLLDVLHTLIVSRLPSNFFTSFESTRLLRAAAGYDCFNLIRYLIENGANAGPHDSSSGAHLFPLFTAVRNRSLDTLKYLVKKGVNINFEDQDSLRSNHPLTALGFAIISDASTWKPGFSKDEPISLTLFNYGADINSRAFSWGATALEWAAFNAPQVYDRFIQHDSTIKAVVSVVSLIGRAANDGPEAILQHGYSSQDLERALIFAVQIRSIPVVRALLQANVKLNCPGIPITPLQALQPKLKVGLQMRARYEDLCKPLRAALYNGGWELVELLLESGADFSSKEIEILWEQINSGNSSWKIPIRVLQMAAHSCDSKFLGDLLLLATYFEDRKFLTSIIEKIEDKDSVLITPRRILFRSKVENSIGRYFEYLVSTPLQVALARGNATLARWLWNNGFRFCTPLDYPHSRGGYELTLACEFLKRDPLICELIDIFLDYGATPNSPLINDATEKDMFQSEFGVPTDNCLHSILRVPPLEPIPTILSLCKKFIEFGANLARIGIIGIEYVLTERKTTHLSMLFGTVVQTACLSGLTDVVKLLVDAGADIHAAAWPSRGRTVLQAVCGSKKPSLDLVQYLLDQHCNVNSPPAETYGVTALQAAATRGYVQIAIKLLTAGADVNAPAGKKYGKTAIEAAAGNGRLDMVKLLINAGALGDTEAEDRFHEAIRLAEWHGHKHIADLLREHQ